MKAFPKTVECIVCRQCMLYVTGCSESRVSRLNGAVGQCPSLAASPTRGDQHTLAIEVFLNGSRVRVINYSPFRGLKGTICAVNMIDIDQDDPFCFYLIALEGVQLQEPIWFEYTEVELISPPFVDTLSAEIERLKGGDQKGSAL